MISLILTLFRIYEFIILVRVIMSWVGADSLNPIVEWVYRLTEPVLGPVRRILPTFGGFDFSPLAVLLVLQIVERMLVRVLLF